MTLFHMLFSIHRQGSREVLPGISSSPLSCDVDGNHVPGNVAGKTWLVVVEDEAALREVICEHLREVGYGVLQAASTKEARLLLLENRSAPMMLVTDLALPGGGGWSLAQWARQQFPNLPIVFMSGCIDEPTIRLALDHGNATFLQKPFSLDTLVKSLESLLRSGHLSRNYRGNYEKLDL